LTRFFSYTYFCLTIAGFLLWGRPLWREDECVIYSYV
jgi:hypothetical protein